MGNQISTSAFDRQSVGANDLVVFGGTFDPIHAGHLQVVQELTALFRRIVVAPASQNPWKKESATPLQLRLEMIALALAEKKIRRTSSLSESGVFVWQRGYVFAEELLLQLQKICT